MLAPVDRTLQTIPPTAMEIPHYRDLFIRGPRNAIERAPDAIETELTEGWARDHQAEQRAVGFGSLYYVYTCERRESPPRPPASLFLSPTSDDPPALSCVNVVPREAGELTHEDYNVIVAEFAYEYVRPAAKRLGLDVELEPSSLPFTAYFGDEARARLTSFSGAANKAGGGSHPMDRARWYAFIEQVHADGGRLDTDVLEAWFVREGWTPDQASRLVSQAMFGLGLLEHWEREA